MSLRSPQHTLCAHRLLIACMYTVHCIHASGVARLVHTGARAPATRVRAPPVQVCTRFIGVIVLLAIAKQALNGLKIELRSIAT